MLYMTSFSTKDGRLREFQDWVKKNEDVIKKSAPRGWTYRGTYGYVLGFGRFAGAQMWECNRYGDFDANITIPRGFGSRRSSRSS